MLQSLRLRANTLHLQDKVVVVGGGLPQLLGLVLELAVVGVDLFLDFDLVGLVSDLQILDFSRISERRVHHGLPTDVPGVLAPQNGLVGRSGALVFPSFQPAGHELVDALEDLLWALRAAAHELLELVEAQICRIFGNSEPLGHLLALGTDGLGDVVESTAETDQRRGHLLPQVPVSQDLDVIPG